MQWTVKGEPAPKKAVVSAGNMMATILQDNFDWLLKIGKIINEQYYTNSLKKLMAHT